MSGKSYITRLLEIVMLPSRRTHRDPETLRISADVFSGYVSSSSPSLLLRSWT